MKNRIVIASLFLVVSVAFAADPSASGPLPVSREEYTFGDTAFTPTNFPGPVEVTASVHYPTGLPGGPYPLVIFLHGRHATCYVGGAAFLEWPCVSPRLSIPSYQGYDYISQVLASHGYIIVSISANGINARDNFVFDLGANARAELIQHHLDLWNQFNTSGGAPFGTKFVGKVDMARVGTMGHSRGGEGVVRHFLLNASLGSPYGVNAVYPLAPVDFNRSVANNVSLAVMLPYCDGDVADLQGVHFYDDARYKVAGDPTAKHDILVMGANHNFFNTVWTPGSSNSFPGAADDWNAFVPAGRSDPHCGVVKGNQRLSPEQQRAVGLAYIAGFFRNYLGGEDFAAQFTGDVQATPSQTFVMYQAPDLLTTRRDVNRLLTAADLSTNTLGGDVSQSGITPYELCGGEAPQPRFCLPFERNSRQPHTTPSARSRNTRGLSQLQAGWTSTAAFIENDLPRGTRDVSAFRVLQFRASVNFADLRNPVGLPQNLDVVLTDRRNRRASVRVSDVSGALYYPPGEVIHVPKVLLNTIRVPLTGFTNIDLTDVVSVRFNFDRTNSGALLISDIAFAN